MAEQLPLFSFSEGIGFSNFLTGPNAELIEHLTQTALGTGEQSLVLWSRSGGGKSHLLQAACQFAVERGRSTAYVPLAQCDEFGPAMLEGLESRQLLCVDDLDSVVGDSAWERALFDLYNRARDGQAALICAARQKPAELGLRLPDLQSRLNWGLVLPVKPLDDEEKIQALQLRARHRGFTLTDEVGEYLLRHSPRDMHSLFNLLDTLDKASLAAQRKITIPFLKQLI